MKLVVASGGEGVIMRQPTSPYVSGRSNYLVKLKIARGDREAVVEFIAPNGTILLKTPDGVTFQVPPSEEDNEFVSPKKGDVVTFSYSGYAKNFVPINPQIERIRHDRTWHDLVHDYWSNVQYYQQQAGLAQITETLPIGLVATKKGKRLRKIFEEFVLKEKLDPHLAVSWYSIAKRSVEELKKIVFQAGLRGGFVSTLVRLFPEMKFDIRKFKKHPPDYWKSIGNRRKLFERFAREKKFDPLVPTNWYSISKDDIIAAKGGETVLQYYGKSVTKALITLFPEVGLLREKFESAHQNWSTVESRRNVFVKYARKKKFDALIAENWYNVTGESIASDTPGSQTVMNFYGGSFVNTLTTLFPDVNFDVSRFATLPKNYWQVEQNRRTFFTNFATDRSFDSLQPINWYRVEKSELLLAKGAATVLLYYNGCHVTALLKLFPEIKFSPRLFQTRQRDHWDSIANRRNVFIEFSKLNSFDHRNPENWYTQSKDQLLEFEGGTQVLEYYKGSTTKALLHVFPNIGLDSSKFGAGTRKYQDVENRKQWFINFARAREFNPFVLSNWDSISTSQIVQNKDSHAVLRFYGGNHKRAIRALLFS